MMQRSPERMSLDEIVAEVTELESELQDRLLRVRNLTHAVYARVRRSPSDVNTAVYIRYANAWGRYSAAAAQGLSRTSRTSGRAEKMLQPVQAHVVSVDKKPMKISKPEQQSPVEALLAMYSTNRFDA